VPLATRLLRALLLIVIASNGGCKSRSATGIDLPRYPGGEYMPLDRREYGNYVVYGAILRNPMDAAPIVAWYDKQLKPGWIKEGDGKFGAIFMKNMHLPEDGQGGPIPIDPAQIGGYVEIDLSGTVTLYQSVPKSE
jgi:hypothetical protein